MVTMGAVEMTDAVFVAPPVVPFGENGEKTKEIKKIKLKFYHFVW